MMLLVCLQAPKDSLLLMTPSIVMMMLRLASSGFSAKQSLYELDATNQIPAHRWIIGLLAYRRPRLYCVGFCLTVRSINRRRSNVYSCW
jgi:hypothetical protein